MATNPLVSIVIPVYNGAAYLDEAIRSALDQSYPKIEVLVVNDGSTDDGRTEAVAKQYGRRIRYFYKPNGKVSSALNYGIKEMKGEYFSWLSHDDVYYPTKIEEQVALLNGACERTDIVYSDYSLIDHRSDVIGEVRMDHAMLARAPLYGVLRLCIHGCSLLIPKKCFDEVGLFNERLVTTGDYELWFRLFQRYQFEHMPRLLVYSRCHDMQQGVTVTGHRAEADDLMLGMLRSLSRDQVSSCEASASTFYRGLAVVYQSASYHRAASFAASRARKELAKEVARKPARALARFAGTFVNAGCLSWLSRMAHRVSAQEGRGSS